MDFFNTSFWQSLASNFAATIIGAFFGVWLALIVSKRHEFSTEKEQKKKILELLGDELDYNLKSFKVLDMKIEKGENADIRNYIWILDASLKTELWESISDSGDLKWIKNIRLLSYISDAYFFIGSVEQLSKKYFQMCLTQFSADSEISGWTAGKMKESLDGAIGIAREIIEIAIEQIDKAKNTR